MASSVLGWDDPDSPDKYLDTWQRTVDGTAKEDQFVLPAEHAVASYSALGSAISLATSADHIMAIQADGTLYTRIRRIFIAQVAAAGSGTLGVIEVIRTTTAGTGGTAITPRPYDTGDSAYGGDVRSLPTAKGTEGVVLARRRIWLTNSIAAQPNSIEIVARTDMKPIIIQPATTNGICLKIVTGVASATADITVEFVTTTFS